MSKEDVKKQKADYDATDSSKSLQIAATVIFVIVYCSIYLLSSMTSKTFGEKVEAIHQEIDSSFQSLSDETMRTINQPNFNPGSIAENMGKVKGQIHSSTTTMINDNAKRSATSGVLAQILLLLSAAITLLAHKKGYIAAVIVNAITVGAVMGQVFGMHVYSAIPGAVVPISTIILISIIYVFSNKVIQKNKEISANYAKLLETNRMIREQDEKLSYLAYYDLLTDLPNRQLFIDKLDETILNSSNVPFTVLLANIDNFKQINNVYGNNSGDMVLNTYAEKLKSFCGDSIFLARVGGDEFGFIIQGSMTEANVLNYVEKIQNIIGEPVQVNDDFINSTISIGIASYPNNAVNSSDMLKCLDNAKFFAKANGKNRPCFYGHQ